MKWRKESRSKAQPCAPPVDYKVCTWTNKTGGWLSVARFWCAQSGKFIELISVIGVCFRSSLSVEMSSDFDCARSSQMRCVHCFFFCSVLRLANTTINTASERMAMRRRKCAIKHGATKAQHKSVWMNFLQALSVWSAITQKQDKKLPLRCWIAIVWYPMDHSLLTAN